MDLGAAGPRGRRRAPRRPSAPIAGGRGQGAGDISWPTSASSSARPPGAGSAARRTCQRERRSPGRRPRRGGEARRARSRATWRKRGMRWMRSLDAARARLRGAPRPAFEQTSRPPTAIETGPRSAGERGPVGGREGLERHRRSTLYLGGIRSAPSSRIVSPLSIWFSTMWTASAANSAGVAESLRERDRRPSSSRASCGSAPSSGVSNVPGAIVTTRMPRLARSRAAGQRQPDDAALRGRVRDLPDLTVERRDRRRVHAHAALAARPAARSRSSPRRRSAAR